MMITEPWRIELFGRLRARQGDRVLTRFRTQKTASLLAYMAYHRGRSHSREVLIELLWPEVSADAGRHSLSMSLSSLRGQLEPPGAIAGSVILADKLSVELNPEAFTTDVRDFEEALRAAARAGSDDSRIRHLAEAVELYSGELLPGYYEDWVISEQERLSERLFGASSQMIRLLEKTGDQERALDYARRAVAANRLREGARTDLARVLAVSGHAAEALQQLRDFERILEEELGEAPSSALQQSVRQLERKLAERGEEVIVVAPPRKPEPPHSGETGLPFGTVNFLFTDIEGSTALWERAGELFRTALARHHALLRAEFRRAGGFEVKESGDGFLVVFSSASDAINCAVACQRALNAHLWPEEVGSVPVRMALHTGDAQVEDGDYHGLPLHRASRMLSAAHGGQIVCSEASAALLRRDLESDFQLADLGVYRLRDVEGAERLFQVNYPEMQRREFPPLRAERAFSARLPLQLTRFFGRERELAQIQKLLTTNGTRLLTLTGPGGTGKTRLGIEAAGQLMEKADLAIWFVPLAELSDARLLPEAVLDALQLPRRAEADALEAVIGELSRQPALLLLDNMEQLVDGGAEFAQTLLTRVPGLKLLVTSRQVLGLDGEREFVVEPLPTPQGPMTAEGLGVYGSVRLFVDRAQAVKPDFQVTSGNAPTIAELCARLEGIPLAIELAAARAAVMSPTQMLQQLGNRFEFLVSRRRGVAERQRTLRAAVDWSFRLLAPDLQRFFARLTVFRGGWTTESAEQVCEEPLALDMLAQLRESSLVLTEADPVSGAIRFRLLEFLREYALERLEEADQAEVERCHASHFLSLAEEAEPHLRGPQQKEWLDRLEAELDNFRAVLSRAAASRTGLPEALRLAGALSRFISIRGRSRPALIMLEQLLAEAGPDHSQLGKSPERALALGVAGSLAHDCGDFPRATEWLEESVALWRLMEDGRRLAEALNLAGVVALDAGDVSAAQACLQEALDRYRAHGDPRGIAMALSNLAVVASELGRLEDAAALLDESLALKKQQANPHGLAIALENLGNLRTRLGEHAAARDLHAEALAIRREIGHRTGIAMSLNNQGHALLAVDQPDAAGELLSESITLFQELEDARGLAEALEGAAAVLAARSKDEASAGVLGASRRLHARPEPPVVALLRQRLGARRFDAALAAGAGWSDDEAVALALRGLQDGGGEG